jgi:hypothetical protein
MAKLVSTLTFCAGLLILTLVYFNAPGASPVEAAEGGAICRAVEVALDEGYGVTRTELREVCSVKR